MVDRRFTAKSFPAPAFDNCRVAPLSRHNHEGETSVRIPSTGVDLIPHVEQNCHSRVTTCDGEEQKRMHVVHQLLSGYCRLLQSGAGKDVDTLSGMWRRTIRRRALEPPRHHAWIGLPKSEQLPDVIDVRGAVVADSEYDGETAVLASQTIHTGK